MGRARLTFRSGAFVAKASPGSAKRVAERVERVYRIDSSSERVGSRSGIPQDRGSYEEVTCTSG